MQDNVQAYWIDIIFLNQNNLPNFFFFGFLMSLILQILLMFIVAKNTTKVFTSMHATIFIRKFNTRKKCLVRTTTTRNYNSSLLESKFIRTQLIQNDNNNDEDDMKMNDEDDRNTNHYESL